MRVHTDGRYSLLLRVCWQKLKGQGRYDLKIMILAITQEYIMHTGTVSLNTNSVQKYKKPG